MQKLADVAALCRRFGVSRLEVFGSAAVGSFDSLVSDYDFFARFTAQPDASMDKRTWLGLLFLGVLAFLAPLAVKGSAVGIR